MNEFLRVFFLFYIGCSLGWVIELLYRRFNKDNKEKKWVNPGFLTGPYLPIYGFGLCTLYLLAKLEKYNFIQDDIWNKIILFAVMALCMTLIELFVGLFFTNVMKVKLWDYSKEKFNYKGLICPRFSYYWAFLGAMYYFFVNTRIVNALKWFSNNIQFSFILGIFFGFLVIDIVYSFNLISKIRTFANENNILIKYEELKSSIRKNVEETKGRYKFLFAFSTMEPLREHLKKYIKQIKNKEEE